MRKPLIPGLTLAALLMVSPAEALQLGDVQVESALNQPLRARIALHEHDTLRLDELRIALASAEDFDRFAMERPYFLDDLRFSLQSEDQRNWYLLVQSREPVREPFLSFVLDLTWPQGRLLSDHTLLLDPPSRDRPAVASLPAVPPVAERASAPASTPAAEAPRTLIVGDADTLWSIATRVRPDSSVSTQQTMLALQALNPDAFIGGNINLLLSGAELTLPTLADVRRLDSEQAQQEVARQHADFSAPAAVPDAPQAPAESAAAPETAEVASTPQGAEPSLSVLARGELDPVEQTAPSADAPAPVAAAAGQAELDALTRQLAQVLDEMEQLLRENSELRQRLGMLESQVDAATEMILLRDDEMARLQQVAQQQPAAQEGLLAGLLGNERALGLAAALLLSLLVTLLLLLRRSRKRDAEVEDTMLAGALQRQRRSPEAAAEPASPLVRPAPAPVAPTKPAPETPDERFDLRWDDELPEPEATDAPPEPAPVARAPEAVSVDEIDVDALVDALVAGEDTVQAPAARQEPASAARETTAEPIEIEAEAAAPAATNLDFDIEGWTLEPIEPTEPRQALTDDDTLAPDEGDRPAPEVPAPSQARPAAGLSAAFPEIENHDDDDDDDNPELSQLLSASDEAATRLNLARAYIDMQDLEGAREVLQEVVEQGDAEQAAEARKLLAGLG